MTAKNNKQKNINNKFLKYTLVFMLCMLLLPLSMADTNLLPVNTANSNIVNTYTTTTSICNEKPEEGDPCMVYLTGCPEEQKAPQWQGMEYLKGKYTPLSYYLSTSGPGCSVQIPGYSAEYQQFFPLIKPGEY